MSGECLSNCSEVGLSNHVCDRAAHAACLRYAAGSVDTACCCIATALNLRYPSYAGEVNRQTVEGEKTASGAQKETFGTGEDAVAQQTGITAALHVPPVVNRCCELSLLGTAVKVVSCMPAVPRGQSFYPRGCTACVHVSHGTVWHLLKAPDHPFCGTSSVTMHAGMPLRAAENSQLTLTSHSY